MSPDALEASAMALGGLLAGVRWAFIWRRHGQRKD